MPTVVVTTTPASNIVDLSTLTGNYEAQNNDILTGTLNGARKISIAAGATVTLQNVTINGIHNNSYSWAGITCNGNATIILSGSNTVKGFYNEYPGIQAGPTGTTLTIGGVEGAISDSPYTYDPNAPAPAAPLSFQVGAVWFYYDAGDTFAEAYSKYPTLNCDWYDFEGDVCWSNGFGDFWLETSGGQDYLWDDVIDPDAGYHWVDGD